MVIGYRLDKPFGSRPENPQTESMMLLTMNPASGISMNSMIFLTIPLSILYHAWKHWETMACAGENFRQKALWIFYPNGFKSLKIIFIIVKA
jgi:hypothetical protein